MSHLRQTGRQRIAAALAALERAATDPPETRRRLIRARSPELCEALTPVIRRSVTGALRRRVGVRRSIDQEAEDVVQAVLLTLFAEGGALEAWDPARELGLEGFVALVSVREVDSMLRSRRRNPWTEEPVLPETLDTPVLSAGPETLAGSRRTFFTVMARLRQRLSPQGFTIFERLFLQGGPPQDVASALGLRLSTIYAWKRRLSRTVSEVVAEVQAERTATSVPGHRRRAGRSRRA